MHLLIVDDDISVRRLVANRLERQGVTVTAASTPGVALTELSQTVFDVAIFDLMAPDGSGIELLRMLRERGTPTHVIVLSALGSENDRVGALGLGADDYVVKPFFVRELTARVLAVRRRQDTGTDTGLVYGSMAIDLAARMVTLDHVPVELTAKEFDLLAFLAVRPRHAFSRDELLRSVWQSAAEWQRESTVTEHVRRLRAKIERDAREPRLITTVRGIGYRFDPPPPGQSADDVVALPGAPEPSVEGTLILVDARIVSSDDAAVEMLGVASEAELQGRAVLELVVPHSLTATRGDASDEATGQSPQPQVMAIRRVDGSDVYVEFSSSRTTWEGGPARRSTIRLVANPSARLRHIVTGVFSEVADAVIVTDATFHVRSWNQAAERLYGWAEHEILGRHMDDVIPFVEHDDDLTVAARRLAERGRWFGRGQQVARDGSLVNVSASTTLIRSDSGEPVVVVSVNRPGLVSRVATDPSVFDGADELDIRRGLDRGEFDVHYQPVVALDDLHFIAVEGLARWNHPERGVLAPAAFIEAAERSGLILELGRVVFEMAWRTTAEWRRDGIDLEIGVNLSTRQLADPALYDDITARLATTGLDPHALWLEVTETALVEDLDQAADVLHRLAALGIRVAIDDFGTGWASLTYLKQFPVHALKIDQIFVENVDRSPQDIAIARSVVSLGRELGMSVVAEGVETHAQAVALRALGCSIGQGYLYGRPTAPAEVAVERAHRL